MLSFKPCSQTSRSILQIFFDYFLQLQLQSLTFFFITLFQVAKFFKINQYLDYIGVHSLLKNGSMSQIPRKQNKKFDSSTLLKGISEQQFEMNFNSNILSSKIKSIEYSKNRSKLRMPVSSTRSNHLQYSKQDQQKLIQKTLNNSYFGMLAIANNSNLKQIDKSKYRQASYLHKNIKVQQDYVSQINNTNTDTSGHQSSRLATKIDLFIQCQRTESKQNTFFSKLINGKVDFLCCSQANRSKIKYEGIINNHTILFVPIVKSQVNQQYQINLNTVKCSIKRHDLPTCNYEKGFYAVFKVGENVRFSLSYCESQLTKEQPMSRFIAWIQKLETAVQNSCGKKFSIKQPSENQDFEKKRFKLQRQFVNECETGDILLFQGNSLSCKVQRFLTSSDFDHIAMVIKDPTYGILMYEAMGRSGINLTPWRLMIENDWYRYVSKIAWRKLTKIERSAQFQELIESFVRRNIHAQYHISLQKLMTETSISETEQNRGYFCSELIAKIYKTIGLLPGQKDSHLKEYKPAHKYYPAHFAQKGKLILLKGELSPEYQIVFCDQVLAQDYSLF